jgi:hypothetical protein
MSHTKGPWRRYGSVVFTDAFPYSNNKTNKICDIEIKDAPDQEFIANANLIAAAPEMLEILESIENDDGSIPPGFWKLIKDVIKKAKGEK